MIMPQRNSFVLVELSENNGKGYWGRVVALFIGADHVTMGISITPGDIRTVQCPPARLMHCHHQPVDAHDQKTGILEPGADDSDAWIETREAIARAMVKCGPHAARYFPDDHEDDPENV
jgi:hypothetical protein